MYLLTLPSNNRDPIEPKALSEIINPINEGAINLSLPSNGKKITNKSMVVATAKDMNMDRDISFRESIFFADNQVLLCSEVISRIG